MHGRFLQERPAGQKSDSRYAQQIRTNRIRPAQAGVKVDVDLVLAPERLDIRIVLVVFAPAKTAHEAASAELMIDPAGVLVVVFGLHDRRHVVWKLPGAV